jgi:hypothetical protein
MQLPNFLIAGAVKSGTTSLNYYLKQHPDIYMSPFKEPRFFAYDPGDSGHSSENGLSFPIRTLAQYSDLFSGVTGEKAIGEASPHYMISPVAPRHIHELLPNVRLIFSLRHPVKRAYSVYWHQVRLGNEQRPVEQAFTEQDHRVRNGRYYSLLTPWYDRFDASQIKVILFEELVSRPMQVLDELYRFLDVQTGFVPDLTIRNKGGAMKNERFGLLMEKIKAHPIRQTLDPYLPDGLRSMAADLRNKNFAETPPMPQELEKRLRDYYGGEIAQLEQLLNRDLSGWKA